jgi:hypothetical protein
MKEPIETKIRAILLELLWDKLDTSEKEEDIKEAVKKLARIIKKAKRK